MLNEEAAAEHFVALRHPDHVNSVGPFAYRKVQFGMPSRPVYIFVPAMLVTMTGISFCVGG